VNEALRAARKAKGLTQQQMAKILGYKSKSAYNMIERGINQPPLKVALKIAKVLDVPVDQLFSTEEVHDSKTYKTDQKGA